MNLSTRIVAVVAAAVVFVLFIALVGPTGWKWG